MILDGVTGVEDDGHQHLTKGLPALLLLLFGQAVPRLNLTGHGRELQGPLP
jgi:hypothetical protein